MLVGRTRDWEEWPFEATHEFEVVARLDPDDFKAFIEELDPASSLAYADAAVVLRARDFNHDEFWRILLGSGERGWSVFVHSPVGSVGRDRLTVRELAGQTIVKVAPPTLTGGRAIQKRILDAPFAALLLILLSPVFLFLALSILFSSGLPIFFREERVGLRGRPFEMLKFRTMKDAAEETTGPVWTTKDDPRRTRLGSILRRRSLDELP